MAAGGERQEALQPAMMSVQSSGFQMKTTDQQFDEGLEHVEP